MAIACIPGFAKPVVARFDTLSFAKTSSDSLKRTRDRPQIRAAESRWR